MLWLKEARPARQGTLTCPLQNADKAERMQFELECGGTAIWRKLFLMLRSPQQGRQGIPLPDLSQNGVQRDVGLPVGLYSCQASLPRKYLSHFKPPLAKEMFGNHLAAWLLPGK